jgi:hypothetical protein
MLNPSSAQENIRSLQRPFIASLFAISLGFSTTLFAISYRKYTTWYRTTRHLKRTNDLIIHTNFFITTCAPLCAVLGIVVASAHYWRKRRKYGRYNVTMRRKGRGYWIDPSDKVDQVREEEARRINREMSREKKNEPETMTTTQGGTMRAQRQQGHAVPKPVSRAADDEPRIEVVAKKEKKGREPTQGLGRSDSVRTCEDDEVTKKGVVDIWLGKRGSEGRLKEKGKWSEGMEMETIRRLA